MRSAIFSFKKLYHSALDTQVNQKGRADSARALARAAATARITMLEVAAIHEEWLTQRRLGSNFGFDDRSLVRKAALFFAAVVRPIQHNHSVSQCVHALVDTVSRRTVQLVESTRGVKLEKVRRRTSEAALNVSERQFIQVLRESFQLQTQLREISHQVLSAQEEERKRISRELHDHISGPLTGIDIELTSLKQQAAGYNRSLSLKIIRTQKLVHDSVEQIRAFARDLRPAALDDLGLIPAIHSLAKEFLDKTGMRIRLNVLAQIEDLDSSRRLVVYRVIQESLTNVIKHAKASSVEVTIERQGAKVCVCIKDNGRTYFNRRARPSSANRRLGVIGMRERVEMFGGKFQLHSNPGEGTTIVATIPFRAKRKRQAMAGT